MQKYKQTLYIMGAAFLFGVLFWVIDGVLNLYFFRDSLRFMIFERPETVMESVILRVSPYTIFVRLFVFIACLLGGMLTALFLYRKKKAEEILSESKEKFRMIAETSIDIIYQLDTEGTVTYASPAVLHVLGYSPEEVVGTNVADYASPDKLSGVAELLHRAIGGQNIELVELTLRAKDGNFINIETSAVPVRKDGLIVAVQGIARDITERRKVEKALAESEELFRSLVNTMLDGALILDWSGTILFANEAMRKLVGLKSINEGIGRSVTDFVHPAYLDSVIRDLGLVREDKGGYFNHYKALTQQGEERWVESIGAKISFKGNAANLVTIRDITERKLAERQLQESEAMMRSIFRAAPTGIGVVVDRVFQYTNDVLCEMVGYTREDLIGRNARILYPTDEEYERVGREKYRDIATSGIGTIETQFKRKDGTVIDVLLSSSPIDPSDLKAGVTFTALDITERKQAAEERRINEERLQRSQSVGHVGSWEYDLQTQEFWGSQEALRIYGLTPQKGRMSSEEVEDCIPDRERVHQALVDLITEARPYDLQFAIRPADGSEERIISSMAEVVRNEQGQPVKVVGVIQDITERKRAEDQIREYSENLEKMVEERTGELNRSLGETEEARDRIDGILRSVADGLIVTDNYGNVILMNRAAEDLLRVRFSELIGRAVDFAIEDKTLRDRIRATIEKKESGQEFDFELPRDGTDNPRIMRAGTSVIEDKSGKETGIITIIRDVTYEREVDRMKTEFISTAAHELRTPLTSIQGFSELLMTRDDFTREEREKFLSYINKQSESLAKIIGDLLDISRIEAGKGFTLDKVQTNLSHLIGDVISYFGVRSPGHRFETEFFDESVEVMVDRDKIVQVLENIVSNAVKYSPDGGLILIRGEVRDDRYHVSVEDEGIGMTPEQVEKVFDKFYRVDASDAAVPGTGLGMSIVQHIIEAHGGSVWVESEFGKGTTVHVSLPMIDVKNEL